MPGHRVAERIDAVDRKGMQFPAIVAAPWVPGNGSALLAGEAAARRPDSEFKGVPSVKMSIIS
jgi:hypothetical protein